MIQATSNGIGMSISGRFKVQVVDKSGRVVEERPWRKNLITNGGMNGLATTYAFVNAGKYAIVGSGSRFNSLTSSTSTITQSGDLVYLYERSGEIRDFTSSRSTYPNLVQLGDVLQYANGSESFVQAVIDGFTLQVRPTYSIDLANSQSFTLWKTSQPNLEKEIKRSTSYLVGSGSSVGGWNCGTQITNNVLVHRRTYNFDEEVRDYTYEEVGLTWTTTRTGTASFSRGQIIPPLTVPIGFRLRVIYDMQAAYEPYQERYLTASILGWPTPIYATESIQNFPTSANYLNTNGNVLGYSLCEPASTVGNYGSWGYVSEVGNFVAPFTASYSRYSSSHVWLANAMAKTSYVNNSFEIFKSASYYINNANSEHIRVAGVGYYNTSVTPVRYPYNDGYQGLILRFNNPDGYPKEEGQKLQLTWRFYWNRILG